jgi:TRAP-type mannitol/chloroaromatic compound transport system permease small subunit
MPPWRCPPPSQAEPGVRFRDDVLGEEPVRVAYLWLAGTAGTPDVNNDALVQVAETLGKRSQLATEIIKGVILPQFVILPLAVLLVWFAWRAASGRWPNCSSASAAAKAPT